MTNEEFIRSVSLPGEEWRDVVGFEGVYFVSSFGRIFRAKSKTHNATIVSPIPVKHKKQTYIHIRLNHYDKHRGTTVHRLVGEAFMPNPNNYPCLDHIDGDGTNNTVTNLRWCTRSMNNQNPISIRRQSEAHTGRAIDKIRKPVVQLKDGRVINIFPCITDVEKHGFQHSCVSLACRGRKAHHGGFQWMYLSDYESQVSKSKN